MADIAVDHGKKVQKGYHPSTPVDFVDVKMKEAFHVTKIRVFGDKHNVKSFKLHVEYIETEGKKKEESDDFVSLKVFL